MASFNRVTLLGNLTRDPEVKYLASGTQVAEFGLAVNERRKVGEKWVEDPCFVDCSAFGKTAEIAGEFLHRGSQTLIEGRLKLDQWQSQDWQKRSKLRVVVDKLVLLGGKQEHSEPAPQTAPPVNEDGVPF